MKDDMDGVAWLYVDWAVNVWEAVVGRNDE